MLLLASWVSALLLLPGVDSDAADTLFAGPGEQQDYNDWLKGMQSWRDQVVQATNNVCARSPDDAECIYLNPKVNWTRTSYVQPQTHLYDRYLYDPVRHEYTVDRYLKYTEDLYGGIDSILIWPTYTNIGIDDRNQWDYFRTLPGGLEGVKNLTEQFHANGVHVLWAYNPWDAGTRDEGESHWQTMARLLKETNGDGFNGDTMGYIYREFWDAGVQASHPFVGEAEGGGYGSSTDEAWSSSAWAPLGWGYFFAGQLDSVTQVYGPEPGVDKLKWLDPRGRRMTHVCDRWAKQRWEPIQLALFNGIGYESWENVWSVYVHFNERDAEGLRRVATMLRWLGKHEYIQNYRRWEPFTPALTSVASVPSATADSVSEAAANTWGMARGYNCYQGAGATDLETPQGTAYGEVSLADCKQVCLNTAGCTGITVETITGGLVKCYRRKDIVPDLCAYPSEWQDTYLLNHASVAPKQASGVYASRFDHMNGEDCVWTIINKGDADATALLDISACPVYRNHGQNVGRVFNLWAGHEMAPDESKVRITVEAQGYMAVLMTGPSSSRSTDLQDLLQRMASMFHQAPLAHYNNSWHPLPQSMQKSSDTARYEKAPTGMVEVPLAKAFHFVAGGVEIEGGCDATNDPVGVCCSMACAQFSLTSAQCQCPFWGEDTRGVDVQFPWEKHARRIHNHSMNVGPFFIDKDLVTNSDYATFLLNSSYKPKDSSFFLRHWSNHSPASLPEELKELPVVYVSLEDARAFCGWAGKRLPHVYEWQLAAQGSAADRIYPWGNDDNKGNYPEVARGRNVPTLPHVGAFSPQGDSPYGVRDMVGLVWQYTDEFQDDHTRSVLLKGSSLYNPILSDTFPASPQVGNWYFPPAREVNKHNKMMLMDDSYERASTLGFRCVADHIDGQPGPYHFTSAGHDEAGGADTILIML
jgi:formylglycine-generating enzyme required for sulfatase activity